MALHRPSRRHINQLHAKIGEIGTNFRSIAAHGGKDGLVRRIHVLDARNPLSWCEKSTTGENASGAGIGDGATSSTGGARRHAARRVRGQAGPPPGYRLPAAGVNASTRTAPGPDGYRRGRKRIRPGCHRDHAGRNFVHDENDHRASRARLSVSRDPCHQSRHDPEAAFHRSTGRETPAPCRRRFLSRSSLDGRLRRVVRSRGREPSRTGRDRGRIRNACTR